MKRHLYWIGFTILMCCYALSANAEMITVTDTAGRKVSVPSDPQRIVCLGPGTLRLIVYLQAQDKVVGVEDMEKRNPAGRPYWIAHPELAKLPRCGPGGPACINKKPDLEAILSLSPQVVFVTYMDASLADEVQKTLGIPVVVLTYGALATFDEAVYDSIRLAGKILKREARADEVVNFIESLRKDLGKRTSQVPEDKKQGVYVGGIGYRGAHGIESTEQKYIPFTWINAKNLAERLKASVGSHVFVDKETLLKLDPDVIFIDGGGLALVAEDYRKKVKFYGALKAFSTNRVYSLLPFNWYTTNIGTALADAYAIGKILYVDRFKDVDPEKKADDIYIFLDGKPVYKTMKEDYGAIGGPVSFTDS
jgi:iron complex transport system substrate-binding protein